MAYTLWLPKAIAAVGVTAVSLVSLAVFQRHLQHQGPVALAPSRDAGDDKERQEVLTQLPYPPYGALPGARDVSSPYGTIRVYEWGPEDGPRVLFLHGISTPTLSLGDLGHELAGKGYRVILFDLFGRGYSDAPTDIPYDARLYTSQILLVLASSPCSVPWTASPGFHLVGYSLGGGLCVSFARYLPNIVRSVSLIATGGLIRRHHVSWQSWFLYNSGLLPEFLVRQLVRRRIRPSADPPAATASGGGGDLIAAESKPQKPRDSSPPRGDGDANGGKDFDGSSISKYRPDVTVASIVRWQVDHHCGFITAFLSTIRNAPIYAPQDDWVALSSLLESRRRSPTSSSLGLEAGKVLIILGEDDPVVVPKETVPDAKAVLGDDGCEAVVLAGGHELPITKSDIVAKTLEEFWNKPLTDKVAKQHASESRIRAFIASSPDGRDERMD